MPAADLKRNIKALNDGREGVRRFAVRRLTEIGVDAVPDLIEALKQKHGFSHDGAVAVLTAIGAPAIPLLINAMNDENREVRWGAAAVLGALREEGARAAVDEAFASSEA
jgi:HEAT repeat protein